MTYLLCLPREKLQNSLFLLRLFCHLVSKGVETRRGKHRRCNTALQRTLPTYQWLQKYYWHQLSSAQPQPQLNCLAHLYIACTHLLRRRTAGIYLLSEGRSILGSRQARARRHRLAHSHHHCYGIYKALVLLLLLRFGWSFLDLNQVNKGRGEKGTHLQLLVRNHGAPRCTQEEGCHRARPRCGWKNGRSGHHFHSLRYCFATGDYAVGPKRSRLQRRLAIAVVNKRRAPKVEAKL